MKKPDVLDPNKRKAISEYERTISTLASAAETRTYLSDAPPNGVSGCYDYRNDRIILYPAIEALDTTVIALEEAGHSQERDTYRTHEKETLSFVTAALRYNARGFLDWFEDWRVFNLLGKRFPGAVRLFRSHWELRAAFFRRVCASPEGMPVDACMLRIAERYLTDPKKGPETYKGTLRAAWTMLRELENPGGQSAGQSEGKPGDKPGDSKDDSTEDAGGDEGDGEDGELAEGEDSDSENGETEGNPKGNPSGDSAGGKEGKSKEPTSNPSGSDSKDSGDRSGMETGNAGPGGDKGGVGGPDAPLSPELAPYIIGVVLLVGDEAAERLNESKDWRLNRQTVRYTGHRWKQVDSALFEPKREDR